MTEITPTDIMFWSAIAGYTFGVGTLMLGMYWERYRAKSDSIFQNHTDRTEEADSK